MTPLWEQKRQLMDQVEREWLALYNQSAPDAQRAMLSGLVRAHSNQMGMKYMLDWLDTIREETRRRARA